MESRARISSERRRRRSALTFRTLMPTTRGRARRVRRSPHPRSRRTSGRRSTTRRISRGTLGRLGAGDPTHRRREPSEPPALPIERRSVPPLVDSALSDELGRRQTTRLDLDGDLIRRITRQLPATWSQAAEADGAANVALRAADRLTLGVAFGESRRDLDSRDRLSAPVLDDHVDAAATGQEQVDHPALIRRE